MSALEVDWAAEVDALAASPEVTTGQVLDLAQRFFADRQAIVDASIAECREVMDGAEAALASLKVEMDAKADSYEKEQEAREAELAAKEASVESRAASFEELQSAFKVYAFVARLEIKWRQGPTLPQLLIRKYILKPLAEKLRAKFETLKAAYSEQYEQIN